MGNFRMDQALDLKHTGEKMTHLLGSSDQPQAL